MSLLASEYWTCTIASCEIKRRINIFLDTMQALHLIYAIETCKIHYSLAASNTEDLPRSIINLMEAKLKLNECAEHLLEVNTS